MDKIFLLEGLNCPNCSAKIVDRIKAMSGIESADFTLATQQLRVETSIVDDDRLISEFQAICDAIEEGVTVKTYSRPPKGAPLEEEEEEEEGLTWFDKLAMILAGLATAYEILIQFVPSVELPEQPEMVIFTIIYLMIAYPILRAACKNIGKGQVFDENFLMAIATIGALVIGEYPEAVGVMLFYRIGEWFEDRATEQSRSEIMGAVDMRPQEVRLLDKDGTVQVVSPESVKVGDFVEVRPGDTIPLDGTLVEGESQINTAPVTGEPVPVKARVGTQVLSGCINESARIVLKVDKLLEESMVSKILDAVENAAASKPKIDRFITRFARVYTPIVVALAAAVAIIPSLITGDWSKWVYTALTFLVISCPCALVLSVPLAFFSGIGNASRNGILLKGGLVIEALAKIKAVALDKTGTITSGIFSVYQVEGDRELVLTLASSLEKASNHPIAQSIVEASKAEGIDPALANDIKEIAGEGLVGQIPEGKILVGNRRLMDRYQVAGLPANSAHYGTEVFVAQEGQFFGRILISDTIRPDSQAAIKAIQAKGIQAIMLTGDRQESADYIAKETGINDVRAHLLPQDKLAAVQDLRKAYGPTMFVGDGINDAPVLAGADVGGAMGSGADAAIEASDVVFMNSSLEAITHVLNLSHMVVRIAWQNVSVAIGIKVLVMLMGLLGYANMWWAVFADTGVAMICILNSIRILYKKY